MPSNFTPARFVRVLGAGIVSDAPVAGMDFAERMGPWFSTLDAIRLQAVHQSVRAGLAAAPGPAKAARPDQALALADDVQRVRAALANAIAQPVPAPADEPAWRPYHLRHQELQRQMDMMIVPLRDHVRQAVGRASARLRQLAALDAALDDMLARRRQALLATTPGLLERRFKLLRQQHAAPDWLPVFEQQWREALTVETDLRLQPVAGLVDALRDATNLPP
ncbi:MAG: hypothetical protein JWP65_1648 [Ramlibacter sp.]|uniref:DUF3348 family protein n=1 Tax=Ramlibacter sp. TaxID=1917967 RepID=UPI002617C906|nr:DUF3348 family protein [Ramlibacter sp.]MDB5751227.1 hypothetical protein [Ramlibacter sp.]